MSEHCAGSQSIGALIDHFGKSRKTISKLVNKVALVTGGSRGIGAAIVKRLASEGATVAFTYAKDAAAAAAVVKDIESKGGRVLAIQADAVDAAAVQAAVEKTAATFKRLDILVNNAGTAIPKPFEEGTLEEFDRVININVRGVYVATQAALKHMKNGGRVIMIGSAVGERVAGPGLVPYGGVAAGFRARLTERRDLWRDLLPLLIGLKPVFRTVRRGVG